MDLSGSSAVVTGGASGLGAATAFALAARGAIMVVADVNEDKGEAVAAQCSGVFVSVDVTKTQQIIDAAETAKTLGPVRTLVNCAGMGLAARTIGRGGYETSHDLDAYRRVLEVNTIGTFDCMRIVGTVMAQTEPLADGERGAIVNTASLAAFDGQIGQAAYSASKSAVVGMTLPVARDFAAVGVRVNTIAPGLIDTPIYGRGERSEEVKAKLSRHVLFPKRPGLAGEFAALAVELLSNSYLNAETIRIDGGARLPPK